MEKNLISIIIPTKLYFLRGTSNDFDAYGRYSPHGKTEYNLYFKNFIYPFDRKNDIEIECEFGENYGTFWRFDGVCDKESFDITIKVFSEYGEMLAKKDTTVYMVDRTDTKCYLLCMGDSMTRQGVYISQAIDNLPNVKAIGTRCYDGKNFCEGRSGWTMEAYFSQYNDIQGVSNFLFPNTIDGKNYYGDIKFWGNVLSDKGDTQPYIGFQKAAQFLGLNQVDENGYPNGLKDGSCVYNDGLFIKIKNEWESYNDEFAFDFSKYINRYAMFEDIGKINVFSILFGPNDLYGIKYEKTKQAVEGVIAKIKRVIESVKTYDNGIKIIINLPIIGAAQYSVGGNLGLGGSEKRYKYNILSFCESILNVWDNDDSILNGIFISPMLNVIDCEFNFTKQYVEANKYTDFVTTMQKDWIHPARSGYKQMGDALASVIAKACSTQQ